MFQIILWVVFAQMLNHTSPLACAISYAVIAAAGFFMTGTPFYAIAIITLIRFVVSYLCYKILDQVSDNVLLWFFVLCLGGAVLAGGEYFFSMNQSFHQMSSPKAPASKRAVRRSI